MVHYTKMWVVRAVAVVEAPFTYRSRDVRNMVHVPPFLTKVAFLLLLLCHGIRVVLLLWPTMEDL